MKKILFLLSLVVFAFSMLFISCGDPIEPEDPIIVNTKAQYKTVILEEFTGVKCGYCPDGHARAKALAEKYPNKVYIVAYHPQSGSFNTPYDGNIDLRRTWPDPMWGGDVAAKQFSGSQSMPGAFVNRRKLYNGIRWTSRDKWETGATPFLTNEISPVNVGFKSAYDAATKLLTVDVQVYFTAAHANKTSFLLVLTEDGLQTQQSGALDNPYTHYHVFREGLTGFLGQDIDSTTANYMWKKSFTFDNTLRNYNMNMCHLVGFIRDISSNEILSGNSAKVGLTTPM